MELLLETKPYLLYETVSMLFKYVNGIPLTKSSESVIPLRVSPDSILYRRVARLQEIMEECCAGLDRENERVQRYFAQVETNCAAEHSCLASMMTSSFFQYQYHDLDGEAEALKDTWKELREKGYRLGTYGFNILGFRFLAPGEEPRDLMSQVIELKYPAEFRLEIGRFLGDYDHWLDDLVELIRPYSEKLRACLEKDSWLLDSAVEYWREQLQKITLEQFMAQGNFPMLDASEAKCCRISINLMEHNRMSSSLFRPDQLLFLMGCTFTVEATMQYWFDEPEEIGMALRSISDKSKFEIIRRLSRNRNYCQKLAEEMGSHPGNVFRNLNALWREGFLLREEKDGRVYYEVNRSSVKDLLRNVERVLLG